MKNNLISFALGFLSCIVIVNNYPFLLKGGDGKNYFVLQKDYNISDIGFLKKGTVLKFDEGMDEGFDRFILYLNLKGGQLSKDTLNDKNSIVPYWLFPYEKGN